MKSASCRCPHQVKLLRVLEEGGGGARGRPSPNQGRCASDLGHQPKPLATGVPGGNFGPDFFYRINVIPIQVPPLRERVEDIPPAGQIFFQPHSPQERKTNPGDFKPGPMGQLMQYGWPGNVRELRSAMEFGFVTTDQGGVIGPENLPQNIRYNDSRVSAKPGHFPHPQHPSKNSAWIEALQDAGGESIPGPQGLLGISRTSVWNQLRKYEITPTDFRNKP